MSKKAALETPSIQSLGRGLSILEAVAESPEPVPLKQLTDLLGIDRSSVFRLANTLRQRRFLANPEGRNDYILGPSAWRLSRKFGRSALITFCHEHLKALTETTGETSHVAVREGEQALFIDHRASIGQVVTVSGQTGEYVPLYCTAHGKSVLYFVQRVLIGILAVAADGIALGLVNYGGVVSLPPSLAPTLLQLDFSRVFEATALIVIFTLLFVDLFDTAGTLIGVSAPRRPPGLGRQAAAHGAGAGRGIPRDGDRRAARHLQHHELYRERGRCGRRRTHRPHRRVGRGAFLLALFFAPLAGMIPAYASAAALLYVAW